MTVTHDFIDDSLVCVEVEGQAGVAVRRRSAYGLLGDRACSLFFDQDTGSPLGGFSTNTTLKRGVSTSSSSFHIASSPC
jgi:hypothetical protein